LGHARRSSHSHPHIPNSRPRPAILLLFARRALLYKFTASSQIWTRSFFVNTPYFQPFAELHGWLSAQHPGLKTFKTLQHKLALLAADQPEQRAMCRLLEGIIDSYVREFDEAPLPTSVADRAWRRLLRSLSEIDGSAEPASQLGNLNRLAGLVLAE
jgi:hypothetical protein